MVHVLTGSHADSSPTLKTATLTTEANYETYDIRLRASLENSWREENKSVFGTTFLLYAYLPFSHGDLEASLFGTARYQKTDWSDNRHQVTLNIGLVFPLTISHILSLSSSATAQFSDRNDYNGTIMIQYRVFFGPGVNGEWPIISWLKGEPSAGIFGDVFWDRDFDSAFGDSDHAFDNVSVKLNDSRKIATDVHGHYVFDDVKPGIHDVSVDMAKRLREHNIMGETKKSVLLPQSESEMKKLSFPFTSPRATIRIQVLLDINNNNTADDNDMIVDLPKARLKDSRGKSRSTRLHNGEGLFRYVDVGPTTVSLDPFDIPEDLELTTALDQQVTVDHIRDYEITFLLRPIRSVRGQIRHDADLGLPMQRLSVVLGNQSSDVDPEGFYWITEVEPGERTLIVRGLPKDVCIKQPHQLKLSVPRGAMIAERTIFVSRNCQTPSSTPHVSTPKPSQ